MNYLVAGRSAADGGAIDRGGIVAQGEAIVFEGPWSWAAPVIARFDDNEAENIRTKGFDAFAVEALAEPAAGEAFVIGAHRMRDPQGFRPYAEQVAAVVERFGGRFLARAGKVTPLGGAFVPDRAVIIAFPMAADAVAFYISDVYAPLMKIRHATTDPRFAIVARSGPLPAEARAAAENYLRSHPASSH